MRFSLGLLAALLLAGCAHPGAGPAAPAEAGAAPLYTRSFSHVSAKEVRTLIVVVHNDATISRPSRHYAFARDIARQVPDSAAVALLRPGYRDSDGNHSPGVRGTATGDNYTRDRIDAVAATIERLRHRYPLANTIVVGQAGGAAIAADLAGTYPDLVDGMVLISCPCELPEWRSYMKRVSPMPLWDEPVTSLDPIKLVGGIEPGMRAAVLVGSDDKTTPVRFSRAYAEALSLRGIATDYRILPDQDHILLSDPEVLSAVQRLAAALPRKH